MSLVTSAATAKKAFERAASKQSSAGKTQTHKVNSEKLILFLKAPRPGAVKTRLAEAIGTGPACAAYLRCVETLLIQLQSLRPVELCFSPAAAAAEIQAWLRPGWTAVPQAEGDLGQRLQSAFQR